MLSQTYGEQPVDDVVEDTEVELEAEQGEGDSPVEYSEAEQRAMSKGWKPDGVEGKPMISADEFLRNESFFERIHKLERNNTQLQKTLEEMANQHGKIAELERTKVLDELKAKKKLALSEEDYDAVIEIDEKIAETRNTRLAEEPVKDSRGIDPDFIEWQKQNTWYDESVNPELFDEATTLAIAYNQRTGKAGKAVYEYVEKTMKRMYPDELGSTNIPRTATVQGASPSTARRKVGPKKYSTKDLNEVQRRVMDRYVRTGIMTEAEYIDELVRIGELG